MRKLVRLNSRYQWQEHLMCRRSGLKKVILNCPGPSQSLISDYYREEIQSVYLPIFDQIYGLIHKQILDVESKCRTGLKVPHKITKLIVRPCFWWEGSGPISTLFSIFK